MVKDALLTIRLTNEELSNLKKIAKKEGLTMSDFVRNLIKGEKIK